MTAGTVTMIDRPTNVAYERTHDRVVMWSLSACCPTGELQLEDAANNTVVCISEVEQQNPVAGERYKIMRVLTNQTECR